MRALLSTATLAVILASALPLAAQAAEPALELRNAFVSQYANRGAQKGVAIDVAAKEGGCIFDVMAAKLTVAAYIRVVQDTSKNAPPADLQPLMPEIKQKCFPGR